MTMLDGSARVAVVSATRVANGARLKRSSRFDRIGSSDEYVTLFTPSSIQTPSVSQNTTMQRCASRGASDTAHRPRLFSDHIASLASIAPRSDRKIPLKGKGHVALRGKSDRGRDRTQRQIARRQQILGMGDPKSH